MYTEAENLVAIQRGEYAKGVEESMDEWCGATSVGGRVCWLEKGHRGKHAWEKDPW